MVATIKVCLDRWIAVCPASFIVCFYVPFLRCPVPSPPLSPGWLPVLFFPHEASQRPGHLLGPRTYCVLLLVRAHTGKTLKSWMQGRAPGRREGMQPGGRRKSRQGEECQWLGKICAALRARKENVGQAMGMFGRHLCSPTPSSVRHSPIRKHDIMGPALGPDSPRATDETTTGGSATSMSIALPSRRTFLTTLSGLAFVSGLGIATVVTIRRGRRMRAEDLAEAKGRAGQHAGASRSGFAEVLAQHPSATPASLPTRYTNGKSVSSEASATVGPSGEKHESATTIEDASSKGVFALLYEMNRAIFSRDKSGQRRSRNSTAHDVGAGSSSAPLALRRQRQRQQVTASTKAPSASVFDADASAPLPSVLMRASQAQNTTRSPEPPRFSDAKTTRAQLHASSPTDQSTPPANAHAALGDVPAVMAVKALGIATLLVGLGTWLTVEIGCRSLQVRNVSKGGLRACFPCIRHTDVLIVLQCPRGRSTSSQRS